MNRQNLLVCTVGLVAVTIAAIIYVGRSPSLPPGPDGLPIPGERIAPASVTDASSPLAATESGERNGSVEAADKHPSQTERVIPEKYSAAPKLSWEKDLTALWMRLDVSDEVKVKQFLGKISTLPPDGKVLAMEYATKLIPDEQYVQYRPTLFGLVSSSELRETVLLDVLTRGETVRMPTLVEMLKQPALPTNPSHGDIREILVAYVDIDYGNDVNGWDTAVKKFLAENPDL